MPTILVFGNSGSGKTTTARRLCQLHKLAHLDLDDLAWQQTSPPQRQSLVESGRLIASFIDANPAWVIEGCYTDLLEIAAPSADQIIYMNLPLDACIANAKKRPWEPHKYHSKRAQDANLDMLLHWIAQYENREDTFSAAAHQRFYDAFSGNKRVYTRNEVNFGPGR